MTSEVEIYYYLKRIDEDLQDELKPKLRNYINLDSRSANLNGSVSSNLKIGIIHRSQRNNADLKNKIIQINFNLIILLIQGAGIPKASIKYQEEYPNVKVWECGTEYLIDRFDQLESQLTQNKNNWIESWIAAELNQISALALLCQGYLAIYDGCEELPEDIVSVITKNLTKKKERVSEASWWLEALAWDEESNKINWEKWEEFKRDIAGEWEAQYGELPDALVQLLKAISENQTKLKQPQLVASAYQSVENKQRL